MAYQTITSDKEKRTALKLCLIGLLGLGGLHRFYVGKIGSGLLYLVTFGFCWIGTLVDLLQISLGSFKDNVGAPLRE